MSNRVVPQVLSLLVLFPMLLAQTKKDNRSAPADDMDRNLRAALLSRERAVFCESWKNGDTKVFESNTAQDFVMVDYQGPSIRSDLLKIIGSRSCQVKARTIEANSAQLVSTGELVKVMYYNVAQEATCDAEKVPPEIWASTVWVKSARGWLAAFHQETPSRGVAGSKEPASNPANKTEEQPSGIQAQGPMPQSSPEMRKLLSAMSGAWSTREVFERSEYRPEGGVGQGDVVFHSGPGGLSLLEDEHSKDSKVEVFGLSVTWWDESAKGFRAIWCDDSLPAGCTVMAKLANWDGNQFVLGDEFERNGKKFIFKETVFDITPNSWSQALYEGEAGSELKRLVTIYATRVANPTNASDSIQKLSSEPALLNMPGPKVQNLMLGTWSIKANYESSKQMPQGGTGDGIQVWRPGPGGRSAIEEEHWRNPRGEFDGFSVGWWDSKAQGQRFVWCANDVPAGCVVPETVAKWEGDRLVFREEEEHEGKRVTHAEIFSDISPTSFTQLLQEADAGKELKTTLTMHATRVATKTVDSSMNSLDAAASEAGLRAAMADLRKASLAGDTERVASLMADEYLQTNVSGHVQDKSAWLAEYFKPLAALIKAGTLHWEAYEDEDVRIRIFGDAAVIIGRLTVKATGAKPGAETWEASPGSSFGGSLRFTRVWIKRDGRWLLAIVHNALPPVSLPANR
jgi:uncharacterized protein (TIGR02246 family)